MDTKKLKAEVDGLNNLVGGLIREIGPTNVIDMMIGAITCPTWVTRPAPVRDAGAELIRRTLAETPATPEQIERARAIFKDADASKEAREVALVIEPELLKEATPLERVTLIGAITRPALEAIQEGDTLAPLALAALYANTPLERRVDYVEHLAAYAVELGDMDILAAIQIAIAGGCAFMAAEFVTQLIQVCMTRLRVPTPRWVSEAIHEEGH